MIFAPLQAAAWRGDVQAMAFHLGTPGVDDLSDAAVRRIAEAAISGGSAAVLRLLLDRHAEVPTKERGEGVVLEYRSLHIFYASIKRKRRKKGGRGTVFDITGDKNETWLLMSDLEHSRCSCR